LEIPSAPVVVTYNPTIKQGKEEIADGGKGQNDKITKGARTKEHKTQCSKRALENPNTV